MLNVGVRGGNMEDTGNYQYMVSVLLPSGQNITYYTATSFTAGPHVVCGTLCGVVV